MRSLREVNFLSFTVFSSLFLLVHDWFTQAEFRSKSIFTHKSKSHHTNDTFKFTFGFHLTNLKKKKIPYKKKSSLIKYDPIYTHMNCNIWTKTREIYKIKRVYECCWNQYQKKNICLINHCGYTWIKVFGL